MERGGPLLIRTGLQVVTLRMKLSTMSAEESSREVHARSVASELNQAQTGRSENLPAAGALSRTAVAVSIV